MSSEGLFHLALPEAWSAFERSGEPRWAPPSLASEGFVHLSFERQLADTLALHFAAASEVVLLELDAAALGPALVMEESRGGERFPHLYRALARDEIVGVRLLGRRRGEWSWARKG